MLNRNRTASGKADTDSDIETGSSLIQQPAIEPIEPIETDESLASSEIDRILQPDKSTYIENPTATFSHREIISAYVSFVFSKDNYQRILLAAILTMLGTTLNFLAPYLLGVMLDSLKNDNREGEPQSTHIPIITLMVLVYTLSQIVPVFRERVLVPVEAYNRKKLLMKITAQQLEKSLNYHVITPRGDQIYLMQKGFVVSSVGMPLLTKITPAFIEMTIAMIALSRQFGSLMGVGISTFLSIYTAYSSLTTKPIIKARENMLNTGREAWTAISNVIARYQVIHNFNKYPDIMNELDVTLQKATDSEIQGYTISLDINYGQIIIPRIGMLIAMLYLSTLIQTNEVSITGFIALFGYLNQLSSTLPSVGDALNKVFSCYPDLRFVFSELAKPTEIPDLYPQNNLQISGPASIRVHQLTFNYPNKESTFSNLSLEVKPGQIAAIVSKSGGGKSTLFNLLYRYYDVTTGYIYINEQNIGEVSRNSLQKNIGLISQNPNLFNGTVRENITFAANDHNLTDEKLFQLADKLNLTSFICSLAKEQQISLENFSKGLDVQVGENGKALSGGQQQKVAIIRGFVKQTPIRLLDEITASLDAESATLVMKGIKNLTANSTTLIITHRLTEISDVDVIFVLDNGQVIAKGAHGELLQSCPLYQHLWKSQNKEELAAQVPVTSHVGFFGLNTTTEDDKNAFAPRKRRYSM